MKKTLVLLILLPILGFFNGCNSDSGDNSEDIGTGDPINHTITSFSKEYGSSGDTITITGERLSTKIKEIKITFDGVPATILSATETEIKFTLPVTEKVLPSFDITINNRLVINNVKNKYNGNIGIFPVFLANTWVAMENRMGSNSNRSRIQMLSDKVVYYNIEEKTGVYRTLDGGITWQDWAYSIWGNEPFYATKNDEGWCYQGFSSTGSVGGVNRIPVGGSFGTNNFIWNRTVSTDIVSIYVDEGMKKGTIVSGEGKVYTASNGVDFDMFYDANLYYNSSNSSNGRYNGLVSNSVVIDNDHIWVVGYKRTSTIFPEGPFEIQKPYILYRNNMTDGWKEYSFSNEYNYRAQEICFVDFSVGFILIENAYLSDVKLYKTTDGGDTWTSLYNGEKFTKFAFKDAMTGWAILDNTIYKTTNGGVSWTLDYTHDQPIRNIGYKNNVVWAISKDKIIKFYCKS